MNCKYISSDKIFYHIDELAKWKNGETVKPITVELHLSNRCNCKCSYCNYMGANLPQTDLSLDNAKTIIDRLDEFGVKGIIISGGGEPSLNKDVEKIVSYIVSAGMSFGFITNGIADKHRLWKILKGSASWVRVSLDTTNKELYKQVRGVDSVDDAIKTVKRLCENEGGTTIGVQTVLSPLLIDDFVSTACAVLTNPIDYYQIRPVEGCEYSPSELYKIRENISKLHNDRIIVSDKWENTAERGYSKCHCYPFIGAVGVDGNLYVCCHKVGQTDFSYGSILYDDINETMKQRCLIGESININSCPVACRGSNINRTLERLSNGHKHKNFL